MSCSSGMCCLMKERIVLILDRLKAKGLDGLTGSIEDYRLSSENTFELKTSFPNHKTFLKYETTGEDEVLRIELTHFFAHLDLSKSPAPTEFLLGMFQQNVPSFRSSGACLGIRDSSPFPLLCLNSTHQFVTSLSDADIAELLSIAIFDLKMGLLFTCPPPVVTWD